MIIFPIRIRTHPKLIQEWIGSEYGSYEDCGNPKPGEIGYKWGDEVINHEHIVNVLQRAKGVLILNNEAELLDAWWTLDTGTTEEFVPNATYSMKRKLCKLLEDAGYRYDREERTYKKG